MPDDLSLIEGGSPTGEPPSKRCHVCHETKPLTEFHLRTASKDGHQSKCKQCANGVARAYNQAYPEGRRDTWRRYRRKTYMLQKYGLTIEQYWELYEAQGGRCKICGIHGDDAGQHTVQQLPLHVDHDHETGAVRGLLCRACNMGLGSFRDDINRLRAAIAYLEDA